MQTLIDLFDTFQHHGDATAFVSRTGVRRFTLSYGGLHRLSLQMARLLADQGVGPGDRVLIWGPNSPWWGVSFWGILLCGAIAVPVDYMSDRERAETIAQLTEAKLLLQSRFKADSMESERALWLEDLELLLEKVAPLHAPARPQPHDTAELIYTSGTTGNPKGVVLTHQNLMANLNQVHGHLPIVTRQFHFLSLLPLSHMFEQMGGFLTPLSRGASMVYLRTLKPSAIMEALAQEDIYAMVTVPRLLQLLKSAIEQELQEKGLAQAAAALMRFGSHLSPAGRRRLFYPVQRKFGKHFVLFVSGGAPLAAETFLFWQSLGFVVVEGYGLTECSPVLAANTMERQVAGSVGRALPGVELKVEKGELLARGANVFPGYYQNEKATREAFTPDGFFKSGDLGEIAPDGWVTIKGRQKELVVTAAGINVYPDELEGVLNKVPGVRESCVIGVPRGAGEEVHAVLILDGSGRKPEEIVGEANAHLDALHQISGFSLWEEPEFPKTTTLKIRKFLVKEEVIKGQQEESGAVSADRLIMLLARITGVSASQIHEESRLVTDLGLTSIDRLELVNYLEQEFRLDIEDSQIGPETRVKDVRRIIQKREKVSRRDHFRFWTNEKPVRELRKKWDAAFFHPLLKSFVRVEARGGEQLDQVQGPVFFVANHSSYLDQPCIMLALPPRLRYSCATAAFEEFFFGKYRSAAEKLWKLLAYQCGTLLLNLFPLPQSRGFSGSLQFMGKLVDHGVSILIFPEGQHSRDGALHGFQLGLGVMVRELGVPVVPLHVRGTRELLPPGAAWPKRGTVTVRFGAPLVFRSEEPREIVAVAHAAVARLGEESSR